METYIVKIQGTSPLLMNRFRDAQIEGKSKKKTEAQEDDITDKLYLTDDGKPYIPANYFYRSMIDAGKKLKVRGQGKSTYSKIVGSVIEVNPEAVELVGEYKPFRISAVNPMTKGRMMVVRPRFDSWSCGFEVTSTDSDAIGGQTINELLVLAGSQTGVGDWRPEKKGRFGKFMVISFVKKD